MNKYETVIILKENITEEEQKTVINKIETFIKENGTLIKNEYMGKKKLAYEIKKNSYGHYYCITFESEPNAIYELQRIYRIIEEIIKFITVRLDN